MIATLNWSGMTTTILLTILSCCAGFVASACFAFGSTFNNARKLAALSRQTWKANEQLLESTVMQSAQYMTGSIFCSFRALASLSLRNCALSKAGLQRPVLQEVN
jgi:ABC-type amino acid transport system permease subunit